MGEKTGSGEYLKVGDSVYPYPDTVQFKIKKKRLEVVNEIKKDVDEVLYPDYHRKRSYVQKNNNKTPAPFQVVNIKKITKEAREYWLKVSLFYRPEDTHKGSSFAEPAYFNKLYFTEEEAAVSITEV